MDLAFLNVYWQEVWVEDRDLRQSGQRLIIALGFFKDFRAPEQGFKVFGVATLVFIQYLLKEVHGLLLQFLFHSRKVDPTSDSLSIQVGIVRLKALVDNLACTFELADVPEEGSCSYQIAIVSLLFTLIHREHECVDGFLIDVAAPLVVENEGLGCRELNLTPILDACQLTDRFIYISFVKNSVGLPKDEHWVLSLLELL